MKKLLLSALALTFCLGAIAQPTSISLQNRLNATITNQTAKFTRPADVYAAPLNTINPTVAQNRTSMVETLIGTTTYDLQANYGTPGQRIWLWDDNTISAIWTFATGLNNAPPERGTGYNYYNGVAWDALPTARLETFRTGFSSLGASTTLGEVVVNHGNNATLGLSDTSSTNIVRRSTKGTGPWTQSFLSPESVIWWPRVAIGGSSGSTIHAMGNTNSPAGVIGFVNYSRSTDGGATWIDDNVLLPDYSTDFYEGPVDAYQIATRGDVVAIAMGGWMESLILWKSTDNGNNWTKTIVNQFPLAPYAYNATMAISDTSGDGVPDTIPTVDSGIALIIDNNNIVHLAVGAMRVLDDDTTSVIATSGFSYFPGTDGLLYWNENMPAGDITNNIIAFAEDIDASGVIEIPAGIAIYQCSLTGMPSIGIDASNNVHIAYSSIIENTTNGNLDPALEQAYRNIYVMNSTDGGMNWSAPTRIEPSSFDEQVWSSMAPKVDNKIHLVYHKDGEPGNTYQFGTLTPDGFAVVDVIYNDVTNPVGLNENSSAVVNTNIYPNPVQNVMNIDYTLETAQKMTINLVDVLGKTVYTAEKSASAGINNVKINVKGFAAGVYSLNTIIGNNIYSEKVIIK